MMAHVDYVNWADLIIFAPATANMLNSMAQGLGGGLVLSMFLAHDWKKPYIVAPAMNTKMLNHPATQTSIQTLKNWGVIVLPPSEGVLACGESGEGKMMEPEDIRLNISRFIDDVPRKKVLITAGGTQEPLDAVRVVTNLSTGHTASQVANQFTRSGWDVTYLHGRRTKIPTGACETIEFFSTLDLDQLLKKHLSSQKFDAVIHLAAVSDYAPVSINKNGNYNKINSSTKIPSKEKKITVEFERTPKLVQSIKKHSRNSNLVLIAFKMTAGKCDEKSESKKLLVDSESNWVVQNNFNKRKGGKQKYFTIYGENGVLKKITTAAELGLRLEQLCRSGK
jgi:phosphopantothenoylcysteine decarboxylase/phosphopantothenate--cysteine ligase